MEAPMTDLVELRSQVSGVSTLALERELKTRIEVTSSTEAGHKTILFRFFRERFQELTFTFKLDGTSLEVKRNGHITNGVRTIEDVLRLIRSVATEK